MFSSVSKGWSELETDYRHRSKKKIIITIVIFILAVIVAFFSIFMSRFSTISMEVAFNVIIDNLNGRDYPGYYENLIVWNMYVPRAIMGVFVGAGLAVGGAMMQALLRNPLAEPYTTGVASGASFGAALFIMMGVAIIPVDSYNWCLTFNAIIFSQKAKQ